MLGSGAIIVVDDSVPVVSRRAEAREVLPPRVLRQVHAVPRGDALDGVDARARRRRPRDADGPRHHGLGPGADHRQLPVRPRRRDGDADRLDGQEVPRRVRGPHRGGADAQRSRAAGGGGRRVPRPVKETIAFSIDGLEVNAPAGTMLADAAKYGDVEIPVFCYEPKLGQPVGACRMCLVEIEGIPKLQTACSTPVRDGMVVFTQTDRVKEAQQAIVEFLLINHPLDCPVCDKGGECPLQDITMGWGPGRSRFIEPKRHFVKPLALSPLIAIDRERCILCYRCVRFSQEISEDYQLVLQERGAHSFVSTFDGHPYVAPFSGNIIELCPVGALTSQPYRFRARPWDIEGSGSVCTLCPAQCNVEFTVRDERVLRVLSPRPRRRRRRLAVRQGPLRLPVRARRRARHAPAAARRRRARAGRVGSRARRGRGRRCKRGRRHAARSPAARRPTRRASCSRTSCAARWAPTTSTRAPAGRCRATCTPRCTPRRCRRRSPTSSSPTPCSCSTASPSTTRRCSTCASARACAATA